MNTESKLTPQILSAYFGSKVLQTIAWEQDRPRVIAQVLGIKTHPKFEILTKSEKNHGWMDGSDCQLLLKRISDITEEHASKCASLCGLHTEGNHVTKMIDSVCIQNDTYLLQICHDGCISMYNHQRVTEFDARPIYAFLQLESYDCGHGSIPSLIDAGVAVCEKEGM